MVALVAVGTRSLIDGVFGPAVGPGSGETTYAKRLTGSLTQRMLLLADQGFDAAGVFAAFAATGAHVLVRCKPDRKLPVLECYPDGSYLSLLGGHKVRVITAEITIATRAGRRTGVYRLATTLIDDRADPAAWLVGLYHQRWEIETCYLELKSSILGGRVLRARTPAGVTQEVYALLVGYQILRVR